jgi:hypothetical protein
VPFSDPLPASHVDEASRVDCSYLLTHSVEEKGGGGPRRFHPRPRVAEGVQGHGGIAERIPDKLSVRVLQGRRARTHWLRQASRSGRKEN